MSKMKSKERCPWPGTDPVYIDYHDTEWGVPVHEERLLFEFLVLEGAQAGLSWITILKRREGYREAFDNFEVERVARFNRRKIESLLKNPGVIRNQLKIESAVKNAAAFMRVQDEFNGFANYQWAFVGGRPQQNTWRNMKQVPAKTEISDALSKDLKRRGFSFVGSTIMYAHMQAVGMVNDHLISCFRHKQLASRRGK
jgi:DNA-3-methyladenine glycosylase I